MVPVLRTCTFNSILTIFTRAEDSPSTSAHTPITFPLLQLSVCCSSQCISKLLQELPPDGPVPASTSSLPTDARPAQGEVIPPPACGAAARPPRAALHPLQPPGSAAHPQDQHAPDAIQLSLQSLGTNDAPRAQAGVRPWAHLLLLLLCAWLHPKTGLLLPEAAEYREPAGPL